MATALQTLSRGGVSLLRRWLDKVIAMLRAWESP